MNEQLIAALAETLGTNDAEAQITALAVLKAKADRTDKAEAAAIKIERDTLIAEGLRTHKLAPSQKEWASKQSVDNLKEYMAAAAPVVPPKDANGAPKTKGSKTGEPALADILAKPWGELTSMEKHALHQADPAAYKAKKAEAATAGR